MTVDDPADDGHLLAAATERWIVELNSMSARNTFLAADRVQVLDLGDTDSTARAALLDGQSTPASLLWQDQVAREAALGQLAALDSAARDAFDERGTRTLFIAVGRLTFPRGEAAVVAPISLAPLTIALHGRQALDADLSAGQAEANASLALVLAEEFGIALGRTITPEDLSAIAAKMPGSDFAPEWMAIGRFNHGSLSLVEDLRAFGANLAESALVGALAGIAAAKEAVRSVPPAPDVSCSLVLDADVGQRAAIAACMAGRNIVMEGPPGTGKSQTIANLIAALAHAGKSALFVTEKRAAIDSVASRLVSIGLGNLMLDLFDPACTPRMAAEAVLRDPPPARGSVTAEATVVARARTLQRLDRHVADVNQVRLPWGLSYFQLVEMAERFPHEARGRWKLPSELSTEFNAQTRDAVRDSLATWCGLGGPGLLTDTGGWGSAFRAGMTETVATEVLDCVSAIDGLQEMAGGLRGVLGLFEVPVSLDMLVAIDRAIQSLSGVRDRFNPDVFGEDTSRLVASLEPARFGDSAAVRVGAAEFRSYKQTLERLRFLWLAPEEPTPLRLRQQIRLVANAVDSLRSVGADPVRCAESLDSGTNASLLDRLHDVVGKLQRVVASFGIQETQLADLDAALARLGSNAEWARQWQKLTELHESLVDLGMATVAAITDCNPLDVFDNAWVAAAINAIECAVPALRAFDPAVHEALIGEFVNADRALLEANRIAMDAAWRERILDARRRLPDEVAELESARRRRSRPGTVRALVASARSFGVIARPCWAMSPESVAALLPREANAFDVVIVDEASQVPPAAAIGALARARTAVIAGDRLQLPPTSFFLREAAAGASSEAESALTNDLESILDAMATLFPSDDHQKPINWHYRSLDESLIAFSNAAPSLYAGRLVTFPGPGGPSRVRHVQAAADEVGAVVQCVREHFTQRPEESLGVVTMSLRFAEDLQQAIDAEAASDELLAGWLSRDRVGHFFVKNLERVQGDERDAIIIALGHRPGESGDLDLRFGPLNQSGGYRRLNVAITRARCRLTLVSSFVSRDLSDDRLKSEGLRLLKHFVAYCERQEEADETVVEGGAIIVGLASLLRERGFRTYPCYGRFVTAVPLALASDGSDRPTIAIELDGPSAAGLPSAIDRDRLRPEQLERLGWKVLRAWTPAWHADPEREADRIAVASRQAVAANWVDVAKRIR